MRERRGQRGTEGVGGEGGGAGGGGGGRGGKYGEEEVKIRGLDVACCLRLRLEFLMTVTVYASAWLQHVGTKDSWT